MTARRRRRPLGTAKLTPPERVSYGLGADGDNCPVPPGARRRVALCQKMPRPIASMAGPDDACAFLRNTASADRESLYAMHIDRAGKLIAYEEVAKGTLSSVETTPREIFKAAILNNASAMIIGHNHPSGNPAPSEDDWQMTKRLIAAGKILGIQVLDHVIVGADRCVSLRTRGNPNVPFDGVHRKRGRARR
jgi:DNA repair protein RadC